MATQDKSYRDAVAFFLENAGYSYDPATETKRQGSLRSARELADAERWLVEQPGFQVEWQPDEESAGEWGCIVTVNGERNSLWGIDFADGAEPWGEPYARVVVAELAHELMPD